jgi:aspartate dehydrogenase
MSESQATLQIGLIGAGGIGSTVARAIDCGKVKARLAAVSDVNPESALRLVETLRSKPTIVGIAELIDIADLVIEAAGPASLASIVPACISKKRDLVVLSVGGLAARPDWQDAAEKSGTRIYCPSGAVAGLDAVKAARIGKIDSITITTRKPPRSFAGSPFVNQSGIDLDAIRTPQVLFSGDAAEACKLFPANVNVAASLSLAGLGLAQTKATVIADPATDRNIHEIEVVGEFGRLRTLVENVPSENARTSKLAAFSTIALLQELTGSLRVGT